MSLHAHPTPLLALSFAPAPGRGMGADLARERFPVRWLPSLRVWEVDVRPHGRIRSVLFPGATEPLKLGHREWAEEIRRTILRDIDKGVPVEVAVSPYLPRESLLEAWVAKWLEHLERRVELGERSPTYTRRLHDFADAETGHWRPLYGTSIHSLHYGQLEDFALELRDQMSQTSVWHVVTALRTCLRWVERRSARSFVCPAFPELQRGEYEPLVLTPEQQSSVLEQIAAPKRGAFLAMADLMIRPGEARALDVEDYDFRGRELRAAHAMQGSRKDARRGPTKGRDRRILGVTARLAEWLEAHVSSEDRMRRVVPLCVNPDGVGEDLRWPESTLRHVWEAAAARAQIPEGQRGLYVGTKHSTATWLRQSGLSLDELGLAMGHSWASREKQVTEGYARPPRVANANIVRLLDSRGR